MKRFSLIVGLVLLVGTVPFAHADSLTMEVWVNSVLTPSGIFTCSNCSTLNPGGGLGVTVGGVDFLNLTAKANYPGTVTQATLSQVNADMANNTGANATVEIKLFSSTFTQPDYSPLLLTSSQSGTLVSGDPFSMTSSASVTDLGTSITTFTSTDSTCMASVASSGHCDAPSIAFNYSGGGFTLQSDEIFTLAGGTEINSTLAVQARVPEPASMLLLGTGLFAMAGAVRRRIRR